MKQTIKHKDGKVCVETSEDLIELLGEPTEEEIEEMKQNRLKKKKL